LGAAAAIALALASGIPGANAQAPIGGTACRNALAGTYLATIRTEAGAFASRALVTLHGDGTLIIADSRQHQGVHGSSFSAQQGGYRCAGPRAAQASVLNFGFPPQESVARSDWSFTYDPATTAVSGTITLTIFPGVEGVDPFAPSGKRLGLFNFTSTRVMPAAR
jgi:hypothetical protein